MIQALQLNIILTFIQTIKTYITLPHFQIVVFAQEVHFNQFIAPFTNNATTATANIKNKPHYLCKYLTNQAYFVCVRNRRGSKSGGDRAGATDSSPIDKGGIVLSIISAKKTRQARNAASKK